MTLEHRNLFVLSKNTYVSVWFKQWYHPSPQNFLTPKFRTIFCVLLMTVFHYYITAFNIHVHTGRFLMSICKNRIPVKSLYLIWPSQRNAQLHLLLPRSSTTLVSGSLWNIVPQLMVFYHYQTECLRLVTKFNYSSHQFFFLPWCLGNVEISFCEQKNAHLKLFLCLMLG